MDVLISEDFSSMQPGPLYEPYSALGEYHVPASLRRFGIWTEATVWHGWKSHVWLVLEENGRRVLEQVRLSTHRPPLLACGDELMDDCEITARLRPLSPKGEVGVVFRSRDCRSFYTAGFRRGELFVGLREHEERQTLASAPAEYLDKGYIELKVKASGAAIAVSALGIELAANDGRFRSGKTGVIAECPCRFSYFEVRGDASLLKERRRLMETELAGEKARYPQPMLVKKFSLGDFGTGRQIRFGDLNGDGVKEILLGQCQHRASGDFPCINQLTALTAEGDILWQIGEPSPAPAIATADLPFQVADVDGDGRAEVIYVKDHFIRVADGATGKLKYEAPTPLSPDPASAPWYTEFSQPQTDYHRTNGDAVALARLRPETKGRDVLLKDRYANIWAFSSRLEPLWHRTLNTGHFPLVKDVDGDGLDEVFIGYSLLDHDGSTVYDLKLGDHVDGIACERFAGPESERRVALAAGEEGFVLCDLEGRIIAQHRLGHVQKLSVGNFMPERPGMEICTINYWGNPGIMAFFDADGKVIRTLEPVPYASPIEPVNWTGDGRALVFLSGHPEAGGLLDGSGRRVVAFPADGHPWLCGAACDFSGSGRDQVVLWDVHEMAIYSSEGETRAPKLRHSPEWNMSNYRASVLVPWD
ncbi:MAG TPA: hypothetical protein ENN09_02745 [Planctomycetes bacterium]|nr:hypothetical protein [Planctomycetota bacterium]